MSGEGGIPCTTYGRMAVNVQRGAIAISGRHVADGTRPKPLSPLVNVRVVYGSGRCECRPIAAGVDRMAQS